MYQAANNQAFYAIPGISRTKVKRAPKGSEVQMRFLLSMNAR
jgi:hypothetical protein